MHRARIVSLLLFVAPCAEKGQPVPTHGGQDSVAHDSADTGSPWVPDEQPAPVELDPLDRDGDGFTPADGDCDDTRADVHPGAEEWCDQRDHDCDGEALAEGVCGKAQHAEYVYDGSWVGHEPGDGIYETSAVDDLDRDGADDLLMLSAGGVLFVPGSDVEPETDVLDVASASWSGGSRDQIVSAFGTGDFDGDGEGDVVVLSRGCGPFEGAAYLVRGPAAGWNKGQTLPDIASGSWVEAQAGECFGYDGDGGSDLDGDGLDDFVVLAEDLTDGPGDDTYVSLVRGRVGDLPTGQVAEAEQVIRFYDAARNEQVYASTVVILPDLDGDGINEVAFDDYDSTLVVSGDEIANSNEEYAGDLGVEVTGDAIGDPVAAGDVDGDGLEDWAGQYVAEGSYTCQLLAMSGPARGGSEVSVGELALGGYAVDPKVSFGWGNNSVPDMDGDDQPEITTFLQLDGDEDLGWCILPSTRFVVGGTLDPREASFCRASDERMAVEMPGGDFTGDGYTDLVLGYPTYDEDRGRVMLLEGWDLPWNDPSYW